MMINELTKFNPPLPPMLSDCIGILSNQRFIKLTYEATKPFWYDGKWGATFSYYAVFKPFIDHPTIAINLLDDTIDLGTDDSEPTHAIVLDRKENHIYLGTVEQVTELLKNHQETLPDYPEYSLRDWQEHFNLFNDCPQRLGMFEFFKGITEPQHLEAANLIHWLDQYITKQLIEQLVNASNQGYSQAYWIILRLQERLKQ
jgi:hypothetical protein